MRLPLRIVRIEAGLKIIDADEISVAYVYAEPDESRRILMKLPSPEEAEAIAKQIARALTENAEKAGAAPKDSAG